MDKETDGKAFKNAIAALCIAFNREATPHTFEAYWMGLGDLPLSAVELACAMAIRSKRFMPMPVELRELSGEKTDDQRSVAAWGDVQRAVPRGSYKHIDFCDPLINATIRTLGGWPSFLDRLGTAEAEKWARIDFVKTYQVYASGGVEGEACAPLPGLSQATSIGGQMVDPISIKIPCTADRATAPRIKAVDDLRRLVLRDVHQPKSEPNIAASIQKLLESNS